MKSVMALLLSLTVFIAGCSSPYSREYSQAVANCLAEKGVKEYGAFWCPNCAKQKNLFGAGYKIIEEKGVYVECDPRGRNAQPELCLEKGISAYPTWEFPDGSRIVGVQELEFLAAKAGCEIGVEK